MLGREFVPRRIARNTRSFRVAHQIVLAFLPCWRLHGFDRPCAQGELVVRNHQAIVHAHDAAKTTTGFTGPHRRVKREHGGDWVGVAQIAGGTMQARRKTPMGRIGL